MNMWELMHDIDISIFS